MSVPSLIAVYGSIPTCSHTARTSGRTGIAAWSTRTPDVRGGRDLEQPADHTALRRVVHRGDARVTQPELASEDRLGDHRHRLEQRVGGPHRLLSDRGGETVGERRGEQRRRLDRRPLRDDDGIPGSSHRRASRRHRLARAPCTSLRPPSATRIRRSVPCVRSRSAMPRSAHVAWKAVPERREVGIARSPAAGSGRPPSIGGADRSSRRRTRGCARRTTPPAPTRRRAR